MKKFTMILFALSLLTTALSAQEADGADIDRSNWTVTTQTATDYDFVLDTGTGSGSPQEMIDGDPNTFLSLIKPGKGPFYNIPDAQPADFIPSFIVDMKSPQTFNYVKWTHRLDHTGNYLRLFAVRMEGSNDGTAFTPINNGELIWIPNKGGYIGTVELRDDSTYTIVVPQSTCQYVKVILSLWCDKYASSHPDYPGAGSTSGTTMQIGEFGLGKYAPRIMPVADVDLGSVLAGGTSTKRVTVSGISLTSVTAALAADADAAAFSVTPVAPASADRFPFTVTFTPTEKKVYNTTLTFSSAGVDPVTVQLTGNADFDLPVQISSEDASDEHWYYIQFYRKAAANTVWSLSDTTQMIVQDTLNPAAIRADQQWKICGTWTDGYYLVNKTNVEMTYNATASEDGQKPADRYLTVASGLGELFDFVRFSTTEDWQFYNRDYAEYNPSASYKYINDQGGRFLCHYAANDAGNRLRFIPADAPAITANAVSVAFEIPQRETAVQSLLVSGLNLTGAITASISGDDASAFGFGEGGSALSATGGTLNVTFSPVEVKAHTATLILTSGSATFSVPLTGNSDLTMPTISTQGNDVWYYIQFTRKSPPTSTTLDLAWSALPVEGFRYDTNVMQTTKEEGNFDQHWKLEGSWTEGYRIINRNGGAAFYNDLTKRVILTEEEAFGDRHLFKRQNATAKWQLQVVEKLDGTYNYLNDWNGANGDGSICLYAANDGGNTLNFIPVDLTDIQVPSFDANDKVIAVKYYTLTGQEVVRPSATGVYIVRNVYASGKVKAIKQLVVVK